MLSGRGDGCTTATTAAASKTTTTALNATEMMITMATMTNNYDGGVKLWHDDDDNYNNIENINRWERRRIQP